MEFLKPETPAEILKEIKEAANYVYKLKLEASEAEDKFKNAKAELLQIMLDAEVDKLTADTCTVSATKKMNVSVPKDEANKARLFRYIAENYGPESLNSMLTINARSFSSWYDAEIEKHTSKGDYDFKLDMLEPYERDSLGIRKRTKPKQKG